MPTPVYCRTAAFRALEAALEEVDSPEGLFRAAFAISLHDRPHDDLAPAELQVSDLARTVRERVRSTAPQALLAHLHDVLFDVVGFRGNEDDYYRPANSYLGEVLRTRRGIPITLVLIYKSVAARLGLVVYGINAPGHFLAGVEVAENGAPTSAPTLMYVDPFYGGGLLSEKEVFNRIAAATGRPVEPGTDVLARATHRQWLARMLNNLQAIFATTGRERDVYAMQELHELLGI